MKNVFQSAFPVAAAATALLAGCASFDGLFGSSSLAGRPATWRPELPVMSTIEDLSTGNRPLRADDRVNVTVISTADGSVHSEDIVDSTGYITLPLAGEVRVGGLTTTEAEKFIADTYRAAGIYNNVTVKVVCPDMIQQLTYFMTGHVGKRGRFPYKEGMTLLEAVIEAGDLDKFASGMVILTRNGVSTTYDLDRIRRNRDEDPLIRPRDIIQAKEKWM